MAFPMQSINSPVSHCFYTLHQPLLWHAFHDENFFQFSERMFLCDYGKSYLKFKKCLLYFDISQLLQDQK